MISLSVANGMQVFSLLYKDRVRAQNACESLKQQIFPPAGIEITDDFGQSIWLRERPVLIAWEDTDLSRQGQIERALHQARTQHDAQNIARSDPKLRMGGMGPGVITPFGPGPN